MCYGIDLNDAIRLIYLCIVYTFSNFFYLQLPKNKTAICCRHYDKRILFNICTMTLYFKLDSKKYNLTRTLGRVPGKSLRH